MLLHLAEDTSNGKDSDLSIDSVVYDPISMRTKFIRSTPALLTPVRNGLAREESDVVLRLGLVMLEMISGGIPSQVLARVEGRGIRNINSSYSPSSTITGLLPSPAANPDDEGVFGGYSPHRSPANGHGTITEDPHQNHQTSSTREYLDHLVLDGCPLALEALTFQCLDRSQSNRPSLDLVVTELRDLYKAMTASSTNTHSVTELATVLSTGESCREGQQEQRTPSESGGEEEDDSPLIFFQNPINTRVTASKEGQTLALFPDSSSLHVDPDSSPVDDGQRDYEGSAAGDFSWSSTIQSMSPAVELLPSRGIDPAKGVSLPPAAPRLSPEHRRNQPWQQASPSSSDRSTQTNSTHHRRQREKKGNHDLFSPEKENLPLPHRAARSDVGYTIAPSPARLGFSGPFPGTSKPTTRINHSRRPPLFLRAAKGAEATVQDADHPALTLSAHARGAKGPLAEPQREGRGAEAHSGGWPEPLPRREKKVLPSAALINGPAIPVISLSEDRPQTGGFRVIPSGSATAPIRPHIREKREAVLGSHGLTPLAEAKEEGQVALASVRTPVSAAKSAPTESFLRLHSALQAAITSVLVKAEAVQRELTVFYEEDLPSGDPMDIDKTIDDIPPAQDQGAGKIPHSLSAGPASPAVVPLMSVDSHPTTSSSASITHSSGGDGGVNSETRVGSRAGVDHGEEEQALSSPASPLNVPTAAAGTARSGEFLPLPARVAAAGIASGATVEMCLAGQGHGQGQGQGQGRAMRGVGLDGDITCNPLRAASESVKHKISFGTTYCLSPPRQQRESV